MIRHCVGELGDHFFVTMSNLKTGKEGEKVKQVDSSRILSYAWDSVPFPHSLEIVSCSMWS